MSGVTREEFQRAVADADWAVSCIKKLSTGADHLLTSSDVDREDVQASLDHETLTGMVNGMTALAERAQGHLEWIDNAWRQLKGGGVGES